MLRQIVSSVKEGTWEEDGGPHSLYPRRQNWNEKTGLSDPSLPNSNRQNLNGNLTRIGWRGYWITETAQKIQFVDTQTTPPKFKQQNRNQVPHQTVTNKNQTTTNNRSPLTSSSHHDHTRSYLSFFFSSPSCENCGNLKVYFVNTTTTHTSSSPQRCGTKILHYINIQSSLPLRRQYLTTIN